jgi:hypothetical protein
MPLECSWSRCDGDEVLLDLTCISSRPRRIGLDGSPAEMVETKAKDLATKHLARLAAGKDDYAVCPP